VLLTAYHVIPPTLVAVVANTLSVILLLELAGHPCALKAHAVVVLVMEVLVVGLVMPPTLALPLAHTHTVILL
jgi:hypothetical protein